MTTFQGSFEIMNGRNRNRCIEVIVATVFFIVRGKEAEEKGVIALLISSPDNSFFQLLVNATGASAASQGASRSTTLQLRGLHLK